MDNTTRRRTKGDGMLRQRSDGSWEGRIPLSKENGKTKYKYVYGKSMKDVREKMRLVVNDLPEITTTNGTYVKKKEISKEDELLFGDWLDTWLTQYKVNGLTPSTYESYRVVIKHHIRPALGNVPVGEVTTDQIQTLLNAKQEIGAREDGRDGKLSTSSVMKIKIVINASLKQAVKNRLIPFNPTEAVTPPKMTRREIRVLTLDEQNKFMRALRGHDLEALFNLALATGMRKGELLALTWDCVDLENRTITISKSMTRIRDKKTMKTMLSVGEPKSKAGYREIPMLPSVTPILERHFLAQQQEIKTAGRGYNKQGLVFASNIGTHIDPSNVNTTMDRILKTAGLEHINFHALRHTFATRALERGISPKVVQAMLGHSDVSLTLNTYTHLLKETLRDEMEKMNALFLDGNTDKNVKNRAKNDRERER